MDELAELRSRLEALEAYTAHQDRTVEELNETITAQWKEIDALKRQIGRLDDQLREVEAGLPAAPIQKPPHY
jgi:SlyX protein